MKAYTQLENGYSQILSIDLQKNNKLKLLVNGIAIIIAIAMVVPVAFFVPLTPLFTVKDAPLQTLLKLGVLLIGLIAYIILHELIHGVAMKICGTKKVRYGFTGLYAFAGSDDYYDKRGYIFIALAPIVLWGAVLAIITVFVPAEWFWVVYFIQVTNISGAGGDLYVTFKFCRLSKDILVKDAGVSMTVYSKSV